jgi:hypothetical protein
MPGNRRREERHRRRSVAWPGPVLKTAAARLASDDEERQGQRDGLTDARVDALSHAPSHRRRLICPVARPRAGRRRGESGRPTPFVWEVRTRCRTLCLDEHAAD